MEQVKKLTALLLLAPSIYVAAQDGNTADTAVNSAVAKIYYETRGEALPIFNGRDFFDQYAAIGGSAFFQTDEWTRGDVVYEGTLYPQIRLKYDIYRDELLVLPPTLIPIVPFSERIQAFSYKGMHFIRLTENKKAGLKTGFYQVLASGELTVYARRERILEEQIVDLRVDRKFLDRNRYFAFRDGKYQSIIRQNQLLEMASERRSAIVQELKEKNLRFKDNREAVLVHIANSFNQTRQ